MLRQPCQKQPSMNTASLIRRMTMSALLLSVGTGLTSTRYLTPRACKRRRTSISGLVSRLLFARITFLAATDDAHELRAASPSV